jgi:hypothetical protein
LRQTADLPKVTGVAIQTAVQLRNALVSCDQALRRLASSPDDDVANTLRIIKDKLDKAGTDLWNQSIYLRRVDTDVEHHQLLTALAQGESRFRLARGVPN